MILHVDMDAFYASIEERDRPELHGKPVIVGGTPRGRGVVAAANYEARKFGVHSAMPAAQAMRLCPHAVMLPSRLDYYADVSGEIRAIFQRFTPLVEPLSLDEAFLDVTGSVSLFGAAPEIGRQIKFEIRSCLQLVASVGVAPNKFLAKVASDLEKPDGFVVVEADKVQQFLDPLPVERLWGVGRATRQIFNAAGVRTIRDVRRLPLAMLQQHFGAHGTHLWNLCRGLDDRCVVPEREAKSISHETTFAVDIHDLEILRAWAAELTDLVARRLRANCLNGRIVQLKVRFSDFRTLTRATTLEHPTDVTAEIWHTVNELLSNRLPAGHLPVRLLGVGVSGFNQRAHIQQTLFDDEHRTTRANLDAAADQIRKKFGTSSLCRASGLLYGAPHKPQPRQPDPGDATG